MIDDTLATLLTNTRAYLPLLCLAGLGLGAVSLAFGAENTPPANTTPTPPPPSEITLKGPWPTIFEINKNQTVTVHGPKGNNTVKLISVTHTKEPDYWTNVTKDKKVFVAAAVQLEVNGQPVTIHHRPYQMPETAGGLRLYVETTKEWADDTRQFFKNAQPMAHDVKLSAVVAGATWGPEDFLFPVLNYRWRSSTYQNTWEGLVPFNLLYYHHGEDLGAVPDMLDLVAVRDGVIHDSPVPNGPKGSNYLTIDMGDGMAYGYAHMNYSSFDPKLSVGTPVKRGQKLAKTGMTYQGLPQQHNDPHVHMDLSNIAEHAIRDNEQSHFPAMIESYFRAYDDALLALAGSYGFADVGSTYHLDGSRSVARPGHKIVSYQWKLHDGKMVNGALAEVKFAGPGYYAEELIVRADDGTEDRDAIHVRVTKDGQSDMIGRGWVYYTPARAIYPGTEVKFLNRLDRTENTQVDFGDGTTIKNAGREFTHKFEKAGLYTVFFHGTGPGGEPVQNKVRLRVLAANP